MKAHRWNGGKWHKLIGFDPSHPELSANLWIACGWRGARGVPEVKQVADANFMANRCLKCFPQVSGAEAKA